MLILVLEMKPTDCESFRTKVNPLLSVSLPEEARLWPRSYSGGRISGFIAFTPDWKPSFFPLQAPYFRRRMYGRYRPLFKFALRPVFESFGIEWQPPPVRAEMVLLPITGILWALVRVFHLLEL